jgi:hypothetical protein
LEVTVRPGGVDGGNALDHAVQRDLQRAGFFGQLFLRVEIRRDV